MKAPESTDIAIVGMGCRFPGSPDLPALWRTLRDGKVHTGPVPGSRWNHDLFYSARGARDSDKTYSNRLALIDHVEDFAPEHFGITPRRAKVMDPQQRLFLDVVRATMEDAGYARRPFPRARTGVFVGATLSDFMDILVMRVKASLLADGEFGLGLAPAEAAGRSLTQDLVPLQAYSLVGSLMNMVAANVSQCFDFGGPAFTMDAACSSALVALHEAILHLRAGLCDTAVVGGVYLILAPENLIAFSRIGASSPSNTCRPFDDRADGFVVGEGLGAVLLKRLPEAMAAGDHIYAVIRGVGMNNDGKAEGPMTPRKDGQIAVLERAYEDAGVSPHSVDFIEAHGTATPVGDATEVAALVQFRAQSGQRPCALSSIKANLGHSMSAAGIAGLIRAALSIDRRMLTLHAAYEVPRKDLELEGHGFFIPTQTAAWTTPAGHPRRAGVNSFGFGGTNVHVVLEEAPAPGTRPRVTVQVPSDFSKGAVRYEGMPSPSLPVPTAWTTSNARPELFVLSAPNPAMLAAHADALCQAIADNPELETHAIAFTLLLRRKEDNRAAFVASSRDEVLSALGTIAAGIEADGIWRSTSAPPPETRPDASLPPDNVVLFLQRQAAMFAHGQPLDLGILFENTQVSPVTLPASVLETRSFWPVRRVTHTPMTTALAAGTGTCMITGPDRAIGTDDTLGRGITPSTASPGSGPHQTPAPNKRSMAEVERHLLAAVARITASQVEGLSVKTRLAADLGFDSLMIGELVSAMAENYPGLELPLSLFTSDRSISELARRVSALLPGAQTPDNLAAKPVPLSRRPVDLVERTLPSIEQGINGSVVIVSLDKDGTGVGSAVKALFAERGLPALLVNHIDAQTPVEATSHIVDVRGLQCPEPVSDLAGVTAESLLAPVLAALATAQVLDNERRPSRYFIFHDGRASVSLEGFAKALAREWDDALVRSVEIPVVSAPNSGQAAAAEAVKLCARIVADEFYSAEGSVEVRYRQRTGDSGMANGSASSVGQPFERCVPALGAAIAASPTSGLIPTGVAAVITGGARGLGAKIALELARQHGARMALVGRAGAGSDVDTLLKAIRATGGEAHYFSCDVCNRDALSATIARARERLGPIQIAIHAAGVVEDAALGKKDAASFARVFDTKVAGALNLWNVLLHDPLTVFLSLGSLAGRFGNARQIDYASANNTVARLCEMFHAVRPDVHSLVLDMAPWEDSGMVLALPEAARKALQSRIQFLSDDEGLAHVLATLATSERASHAASAAPHEYVLAPLLAGADTGIAWHRIIDEKHMPYLRDHRIAGRAVLPLAGAIDWIASAAASAGLAGAKSGLHVRDLGVVDGVVVDSCPVDVMLRTHDGANGVTNFDIVYSDRGAPRTSFRGRIVPGNAPTAVQHAQAGRAPRISVEQFFAEYTFHGPGLQALHSVTDIGAAHVRGALRALPVEGGTPLVSALDGMLQLCAYYAAETYGLGGLPVHADTIHVARIPADNEVLECTAVLVPGDEETGLSSDADLVDAQGRLVIAFRGMRAELRNISHSQADGVGAVEPRAAASPRPKTSAGEMDTGLPSGLPSDRYRPEEFPEVRDLEQRIALAAASGIVNPYFRSHDGTSAATASICGRTLINFSSYNYLGLCGHPEVNRAAKEAVDRYGSSVSASRVASGERPLHHELEAELAELLGCEDSVVMVGGHATNVSVIGHLLGPEDLVIHDSLAHNSILGGARLSGARRRPFAHNDPDSLERILRETRSGVRRVLIAIEGVYSMDGDIAPLDRLIALKRKYGAMLLVDEAHSIGVLGETGRGIGEYFHVERADVELWMGTLSKSFASCGGYIAGSRHLIQYLRYTVPGFVYSVGISPANAAAALAAIRVMREHPELPQQLRDKCRFFLRACRERGIDTGQSHDSAVVPCIVRNSYACLRLSQALEARGINVQPIVSPAVEEDHARLRFFVSVTHTEEQLLTTADILAEELLRI